MEKELSGLNDMHQEVMDSKINLLDVDAPNKVFKNIVKLIFISIKIILIHRQHQMTLMSYCNSNTAHQI